MEVSQVGELRIGDVARQAGIRTSTLRYYESIGLLPPPRRVNGVRRYDESILQRLAILQMAQRAGFTIAEMQRLLHGFGKDTPPAERWRALAEHKLPELDALIARAQETKRLLERGLRCDCERLEECVVAMETEREQPGR